MFEIQKRRNLFMSQRYWWILTAENNRTVAASSEGFYSHAGALENAELTLRMLAEAKAMEWQQ